MASRPHVLVIGSSNTDLIVRSASLPGPGQTVMGADTFVTLPGGKGANPAGSSGGPFRRARLVRCTKSRRDAFGEDAPALPGSGGHRYDLRDERRGSAVGHRLDPGGRQGRERHCRGSRRQRRPFSRSDRLAPDPFSDRASACLLQLETPLPTVLHAAGDCERTRGPGDSKSGARPRPPRSSTFRSISFSRRTKRKPRF